MPTTGATRAKSATRTRCDSEATGSTSRRRWSTCPLRPVSSSPVTSWSSMAATINTGRYGPAASPTTSRCLSARSRCDMAVNYRVEWPMSLGAAPDSLEAKQPDIDNRLDVVDPSRYYSPEFMQREWQSLWPHVWLLAGVASDIPEEGDYFTFAVGPDQCTLLRQADESLKSLYKVFQ